ncbi:uncharacterized protein MYCFIDRAFT_170775 [Pseudocercospora fijiensis CIRAD86]|uniref:Uncharacterized protein n=1 Tax=Pseudocercospora fijiensis (strain CIRAD86) TaxID=383855 RepID=N1Q8U2_PSEFD|nr:uncharacterized protein MYCFIDRAFT_170775 [Pseudocercospora fijiensis CIRAD86]EME89299.1 hypothetical protein MYCFIDRAFT_170775 [Pseudocercospora fijiensis CIRAD86]
MKPACMICWSRATFSAKALKQTRLIPPEKQIERTNRLARHRTHILKSEDHGLEIRRRCRYIGFFILSARRLTHRRNKQSQAKVRSSASHTSHDAQLSTLAWSSNRELKTSTFHSNAAQRVSHYLINQEYNCDDQYSQADNNDSVDQNYNAANYIPQCNSCILQDPNYLNSNNNHAFNNHGYNGKHPPSDPLPPEVLQWTQTCNFQNGGIVGGNFYPTPTYNGYVNPTGVYGDGGNGYELVYTTIFDQNGDPQVLRVVQTPVPTGGAYYYPGDYGYMTSYDQYGNPQVIQTGGGGEGNYYPGNVIGGNYGNPISVSYTTTTETDQFGNRQTFVRISNHPFQTLSLTFFFSFQVTPVSTYYASLTTSWSTTRSTDAFGHTQTYSGCDCSGGCCWGWGGAFDGCFGFDVDVMVVVGLKCLLIVMDDANTDENGESQSGIRNKKWRTTINMLQFSLTRISRDRLRHVRHQHDRLPSGYVVPVIINQCNNVRPPQEVKFRTALSRPLIRHLLNPAWISDFEKSIMTSFSPSWFGG